MRQSFGEWSDSAQPVLQAVSGLGGMGKTQMAVEYAYRYEADYRAILWVQAETETTRLASFLEIAQRLKLPPLERRSPADAIRAGLMWLTQNPRWLLVFDNADQPEQLHPLCPQWGTGHILITSRAQRFDCLGVAQPMRLAPLSAEDAVAFLLQRTGRSPDDAEEIAAAREFAVEVGGLPLALEQAAAYIVDRQIRFQDYLISYRRHKLTLLQRSRPVVGEYPESVATTWALNFLQVDIDSPAAAALLRISAFLAPDAIPYALFEQGYERVDSPLKEVLAIAPTNPTCVPELLTALSRFSLVNIEPTARSYSVHRLVQAVIRDDPAMDDATCRGWAIQAIEIVGAVFPEAEFEHWSQCDRLLPHALTCRYWMERYSYESEGAARLLNQTGYYLTRQGRYDEAEPLLVAAVAMRRTLLGSLHLDLAMSMYHLGTLYRAQGRYDEAEAHYQEALTLRQTLLAEDHPEIAVSLNNLSLLHQYQGRFAESERLQQQAIAMRQRLFGAPRNYAPSVTLGYWSKATVLFLI